MTPYYQDKSCTIWNCDCRAILPAIGKVDLVLTDPPYGTGGRRRIGNGQGSDPKSRMMRESWDYGHLDWIELLPDCAWMIFWPSGNNLIALMNAAESRGRKKVRQLYWKKSDPMPQPGNAASFSVESIWVFTRAGCYLKGLDWFEDSTPRSNRDADATGHPYQKPYSVMTWLVGLTAFEEILDPFCGSGTTLVAAKSLSRRAIGIELSEEYCEIAARRLQQEVLPLNGPVVREPAREIELPL